MIDADDAPVPDHRGGIEQLAFGALDEAHDQRLLWAGGGQLIQRRPVVLDELLLIDQVLRRIAADRQLRKQHQVRPGRHRLRPHPLHLLDVAGQVAHRRIELP